MRSYPANGPTLVRPARPHAPTRARGTGSTVADVEVTSLPPPLPSDRALLHHGGAQHLARAGPDPHREAALAGEQQRLGLAVAANGQDVLGGDGAVVAGGDDGVAVVEGGAAVAERGDEAGLEDADGEGRLLELDELAGEAVGAAGAEADGGVALLKTAMRRGQPRTWSRAAASRGRLARRLAPGSGVAPGWTRSWPPSAPSTTAYISVSPMSIARCVPRSANCLASTSYFTSFSSVALSSQPRASAVSPPGRKARARTSRAT